MLCGNKKFIMFKFFKNDNKSNNLIGKKVTIEYFDQSETFAKLLPKSGEIIKQYNISGAKDWYLVKLDKHIDFSGRENYYILIRSRWEGKEILKEETSVFIVLIPDMKLLDEKQPLDIEKFELVAWGIIK